MRYFRGSNILLFATFLFWGYAVHAQQTKRQGSSAKTLFYQGLDNDSILSVFLQRFIALDSLFNRTATVEDKLASAYPLFTEAIDSVYDEKRKYERKTFKRKTGLELTGQAYQRLDNELGFDEDEDRYSRYNTKFQGEVGWNFFNSAFLQRKSELRLIDLTNQAEWLRQRQQYALSVWDEAEEAIERKYNALAVGVLREQLLNVEVLGMAYRFVLEKDRADNEKLLDAMNEQMRIEYAIAQAGGQDTAGEAADGIRLIIPTVIEVDSTQLFRYLSTHNAEIKESQVREEMLGVKIRLTNYAHQMRLTPFIRASHYLRTDLPSSTNVEVGARFTFPLYDDTSTKRKALKAEQAIAALGRENLSESLAEQCRYLLARLDRLNRAIETEQRHTDQLRRFIGLRREAYLNSLNGYNHIARLEEYNEYLKSIERMYNLLRLRSLCLLHIQKASGCLDLTSMITIKGIAQ